MDIPANITKNVDTENVINNEEELSVPFRDDNVSGTLTFRKKENQWYGDLLFHKSGDKYNGQLASVDRQSIRPHGIGKMVIGDVEKREDVYSGEFCEGKPHGWGRMKYRDGVTYEGGWRLGVAHGKGRMTTANKVEVEAIYLQGRPSGKGTIHTPYGKRFEGKFVNGTRHVVGKLTFPSGAIYEGVIKNGKAHGSGRYTDKDGNVQNGKINFATEAGEEQIIL